MRSPIAGGITKATIPPALLLCLGAPQDDSAKWIAAARRVDRFLCATGAQGGVLIAVDGKILLAAGYGWADETHKTPITTKTPFDIGSVSKQFTGAAILKLQEQGKLRVTDAITRYFNDVPADKMGITIHQLLTHTAGIAHDVVEFGQTPARDEAVRQVLASNLIEKPGVKYHYSNAGFSLLAAIVEIASGTTFEQYLHSSLWKPAGMLETGWKLPEWPNGVSHGCDIAGDLGSPQQNHAPDGPSWRTRGAGAVISTLDDLYKWHLALADERVLSNESKKALFNPHVPEDDAGTSHYGYGWALFTTPRKTKLIAHDGSNGTYFANFLRYVDENVVILFFTNERNSISQVVIRSIPELFFLFGGETPMDAGIDPSATKNPAESIVLDRYAGTYQFESGERFELHSAYSRIKGQLTIDSITPVAGRLLTSFPPLPDPKDAEKHAFAAVAAVRAILDGKIDSVKTQLRYDDSFDDEKNYWTRTCKEWNDRFGAFQSVEVLGTVLGAVLGGGKYTTYQILHFERGSTFLQIRRETNDLLFIGTANNLLARHYRFIPSTETEFTVTNNTLKTMTSVTFELDANKSVAGLVIVRDGKTFRAKKIGN